MRFSLIPREMRFYDMLEEASAIVSSAAVKFLEMVTKFDNLAERARDLKVEEERCDAVIERIIKALNLSFITPFDREDIHTLATSLDDILDNLEETAHRISVFRIDKPTPETVTLARYIVECCGHLEKAISLSRNLNNHEEIYKHLVEIGRLENEADNIYRNADAALFANGHDAATTDGQLAQSNGSVPAKEQGNGASPVDVKLEKNGQPKQPITASPAAGESEKHDGVQTMEQPEPKAVKLEVRNDRSHSSPTPTDILMLIKLREIYSWLEESVDACKDVANVISEIVIKGS